MGCRIWVVMLVAVATAMGQNGARLAELPYFTPKSSGAVVFFYGQVMLDDGSAPIDPVRVERVCDGHAVFEAWSDKKGGFSFKVSPGGSEVLPGDVSQPGAKPPDSNGAMNPNHSSAPITTALVGCELQAVLGGYRSERLSIDPKTLVDDARVGTIILHPLSRASALTISATSLAAPPNARKAYERGLEAMRTQKWDAAAVEFTKAVKVYPKYAVAWYRLGLARQTRNDASGAVEAWKQAQSSDPRYIEPYEELAAQADRRGDWAESEKYSHMWIQLDPEDFTGAYLFNAVANARLNRTEEAERAAREGLRLDKDRKLPRLNYVLALILMKEQQYGEAAQLFRKYVELAPNAGDAALVRQQLPKIDEMASAARVK